MSGRTYFHYEVIQWGYVALVCIALAFTSLNRAAASTKPSDYKPEVTTLSGDACLVKSEPARTTEPERCEVPGKYTQAEPIESTLGSPFMNTSLERNRNGLVPSGPTHQQSAY